MSCYNCGEFKRTKKVHCTKGDDMDQFIATKLTMKQWKSSQYMSIQHTVCKDCYEKLQDKYRLLYELEEK